MAYAQLKDVSLRFSSDRLILSSINLDVRQGEFLCIVGPSGCGKTTILGLISSLLEASSGCVTRSPDISGKLAYVFQQDHLLPWKTCLDNVALPLMMRGTPNREARAAAWQWLAQVHLQGFEAYYPSRLSGGMQKRVNLARSLAYSPRLLLMDEPFAALDAQTRNHMQELLLDLWNGSGQTIVFVTHDLEEAILLADRVVIMTSGPGATIKESFDISLGRPRNLEHERFSEEFRGLYRRIWTSLGEEVRRAQSDVTIA